MSETKTKKTTKRRGRPRKTTDKRILRIEARIAKLKERKESMKDRPTISARIATIGRNLVRAALYSTLAVVALFAWITWTAGAG